MNDEVNPADLPLLLRGSVQPGGYLTSNVANRLLYAAADYIESKLADEARTHDAPSAPAGQEWTDEQCIEFASCAFRNAPRNPPEGVELTDIRMAASRVMRSAPPAAQAVDLEQFRRLGESWRHGWGAQGTPTEIAGECADELIKLIDQQAGKGVDRA